jgi:hypothetical protein
MTASPESYAGPVAKDLCDLAMETPLGRRQRAVEDAARALQELHGYPHGGTHQPSSSLSSSRTGLKRSRTVSMDNGSLQENVREMLGGCPSGNVSPWPDTMVRLRAGVTAVEPSQQLPVRAACHRAGKRVCCSAEAAEGFAIATLQPAVSGFEGPDMWDGFLN